MLRIRKGDSSVYVKNVEDYMMKEPAQKKIVPRNSKSSLSYCLIGPPQVQSVPVYTEHVLLICLHSQLNSALFFTFFCTDSNICCYLIQYTRKICIVLIEIYKVIDKMTEGCDHLTRLHLSKQIHCCKAIIRVLPLYRYYMYR